MKKIFINAISKHSSLLIMVLGALLYFVTNLALKEGLTKKEYGYYAINVTFFSLVFIYGLLGFEQVFLRHSFVLIKNIIFIQKTQIFLFVVVLFLTFALIFIFIPIYYGNIFERDFLFGLSVISMASLTILYSIFRLNEDFVIAQLILNGYKILLFLLLISLLIISKLDLQTLFYFLLYVPIIIFVISVFVFVKKIKISINENVSNKTLISSHLYFFVAISSFTLINFCDRFIIESKLGTEKIGDYFFLTNVFLAPFAIIQNYVGFKQLVAYKKKFDFKSYNNYNKKVLQIAIILSLILLLSAFISDITNILNFKFLANFKLILLLLLLAITRMISLSINAAFDVVATNVNLRNSNLFLLTISLIILYLIYIFPTTIEIIALGLLIIWVVRAFVMNRMLLNQSEKL